MIQDGCLYKGASNPNFSVQDLTSDLEGDSCILVAPFHQDIAILITGNTTLLTLEVETSSLGEAHHVLKLSLLRF
jgi:hypothetical protein